MSPRIFVFPLIGLLSGCSSSLFRPLTTGLAATGGAALGSTLTRHSLAGAAAGAAGGVILSEGFQQLKSSSEKKAFQNGYQQALSDQIKEEFWRQQFQHLPSSSSTLQVPVPMPERITPDGVRLVPSTEFIPIHP